MPATTAWTISSAWSSRARSAELALVAVVAIPLLFAGLGLSFLDPDEGLYGDMATAMAADGGWVIPRFNGLPYLEKPPLYMWLSAASLAAGAPVEWALRAWSALSAFGSVLLAWRIGRRLHGPAAGVLAAIVLATTAGYALYVRKASTDFVFVLCFTLALYGFLRDAERRGPSRTRFLWMYAGMALGVLTKGFIGVLLPGLVVALAMAWVRRLSWRDLNLGLGSLVFLVLVVPWHAAAAWQAPDLFAFYVVDNQLLRFLDLRGFVEDDVPTGALRFAVVTFLWLFPWGVLLLARPAPSDDARAAWRPLVVIWLGVVVLFFALSRSTLEYYALPAFPAAAVLVGAAWVSGRDIGRWLAVGLIGCVAAGAWMIWAGGRLTPEQALAGLAELNVYYRILQHQNAAFPYESARPFGILLQWLGAVIIVGWSAAALCWWRRWRRASFACLVAVGVGIASLIVALLAVVEPHHSVRAVAAALASRLGHDDVVVHEGPLEYSAALPLYTGRRIVIVNGGRGDLDFASRTTEARGYFLDRDGFAGLWAAPRRVFLVTQRSHEQSVIRTLPSAVSLGRFGSRWLYSNRRD